MRFYLVSWPEYSVPFSMQATSAQVAAERAADRCHIADGTVVSVSVRRAFTRDGKPVGELAGRFRIERPGEGKAPQAVWVDPNKA